MERSEQKIKTYEGFFDRFKGEYGYRVGKKPKKNYGEKFLSLLEISVSDIQYLLTEITDVIQISIGLKDPNSINDPEEDLKFNYKLMFIDRFGAHGINYIYLSIKDDKFLPALLYQNPKKAGFKGKGFNSNDPNTISKFIDNTIDDEFAFTIEFFTKDIYNDNSDTTFLKKVKKMNFNYTSLSKEKIEIIKECGERICDMIDFEKFELDIKNPENGHITLVKLIFKI